VDRITAINLKRLLLTLPLLFSSCQNRGETDENSPYFVIPLGSRLSCAVWQTPATGQSVSGRELRQALGNIFTLELAGRASSAGQRP
jgi:hypothetical protein